MHMPSVQETRPEPQIDDTDLNGETKYANYAEYHQDLRDWDRESVLREFRQGEKTMTKEDFQKIEEMIEDGGWRVIGFVALILGHYWLFGICLLMPVALRAIKTWGTKRRGSELVHSPTSLS
jgi:hypothetical protein